jgi:hypothetical protein
VFFSHSALSQRLCRLCRRALTKAFAAWLFASGGAAVAATSVPVPSVQAPSAGQPEGPSAGQPPKLDRPAAASDEGAKGPLSASGASEADAVAGASDDNGGAPPHDEGVAGPDDQQGAHTGRLPSLDCLARTLCEVKDKIRWQTPRWSTDECRALAGEILKASRAHDVSPTLLLAVMINESDLNEKAIRVTFHGPKVYARDGGLMGIRCLPDAHDRCTNGYVRGLPWQRVMEPRTNIELGAAELARWRTGGVTQKTVRLRSSDGTLRVVTRNVPCQHKSHGFWAHYNHGPRYIDRGYARHYPHRVAVLDNAVAEALGTDAPELKAGRITMQDPGKRERRADRPVEARYRKLYSEILSSAGKCELPAYALRQ